ncbi:hypothetical protein [Pseudomonas alcaligenes]|uniref:hypothetical protein n=1 Tax=Aquipseudomonas alcaligenes TaxID=43263 RepID=UPI00358E478D
MGHLYQFKIHVPPRQPTHFNLQIDDLDLDLQDLEFSGREALDQPCRFEVELVSERPELFGTPAFRNGNETR